MNKTTQGLVIGLATALIGVLFTPGPALGRGSNDAAGYVTVVRCNR